MIKALAVISVEIAVAVSAIYASTFAQAHAATCVYEDGTVGTDCLWTVEVDGQELALRQCVEEDGNADGKPCIWFDPDTNRGYYVTSEDYR